MTPTTGSGLVVEPVYSPDDLSELDSDRDLGLPGEYPYARGISPRMYRDALWVMGQYSGYASAKQTNARIRDLLAAGQNGFSIALDLPTQLGLDSDDPRALGEVGKVGVAIDSLDDMIALLADIPLDQIRQIRTTANAIAPIAIALFIAAAEHHGYSPTQFRVMLQNDVLKEYVARGTQIFPPAKGLRFSVDAVEYCARNLPHWEPIEFCGYHIRDAGANAYQEIAIASANGIEYVKAMLARGLEADSLGESFVMFLSASIEILEEVAKFRAARRLWARVMRERFGVENPRLKIFCYTLGSPLTAQQPLNNIVRVAYEALAAILGGTQTLATSSFDEALGLPSDEAVNVSLRTQQILAYETGITRTADPLGGSYVVESLTNELERRALEVLLEIDELGGALAALEQGWIAELIDAEAYGQHLAIENGERVVVGVNAFCSDETNPEAARRPLRSDHAFEAEQVRSIAEVRRSRDQAAAERSLERLRHAAAADVNTVPFVLDAVRSRATIGEICGALKEEWGAWSA